MESFNSGNSNRISHVKSKWWTGAHWNQWQACHMCDTFTSSSILLALREIFFAGAPPMWRHDPDSRRHHKHYLDETRCCSWDPLHGHTEKETQISYVYYTHRYIKAVTITFVFEKWFRTIWNPQSTDQDCNNIAPSLPPPANPLKSTSLAWYHNANWSQSTH